MRNRVRIEHLWEEGAIGAARKALTEATAALAAIAALPPGVANGNLGKVAEFVQHAQLENVSVAPGSAVQYNGDQGPVVDTIGITLAAGPGAQGTAFELPPGTYLVDWENSNGSAWSLAIYKGSSPTVMAIDNNTIAGASTATSWIHGRAYVVSTVATPWVMVSPVVGTAAIPTAGTATGQFIARITFLRLS